MLISREQISNVEKYFIKYYKYKHSDSEEDNRMAKVVEKIMDIYRGDKEKMTFINLGIIAQKTWQQMYDVLHIERRTYFTWKEEILSDAVICAAINGLLGLEEGRI